jgi:TetR/AcrR family transcriptional regulator, lmrAB and yxaGH operons repressor
MITEPTGRWGEARSPGLQPANSESAAASEEHSSLFVACGMCEDAAHRMATVTIAATEGAVVLSRAQQSTDPFDDVAITLSDLVRDVA